MANMLHAFNGAALLLLVALVVAVVLTRGARR